MEKCSKRQLIIRKYCKKEGIYLHDVTNASCIIKMYTMMSSIEIENSEVDLYDKEIIFEINGFMF